MLNTEIYQRFFCVSVSYYEKFADGKVVCIDDEIPFEIPAGWEWARINNIAISQLGKTLDRGRESGKSYPYLCSINVYWEGIDLSKVKTFLLEDNELERYRIDKGDLLICEGGDYARCSVWDKEGVFYYQNALHRVRFFCGINPYFYKFVVEYYRMAGIIVGQGQTIQHFTYESMKQLCFPVPPLSEQNKIITFLNTLTPLITQYGKSQKALDNLNAGIVSRLKASILHEAIQGKLVPQDSNDEPARKLLEKINAEKQRLVKEGKLKAKDASSSTIFKGEDNKYYEQIGSKTVDISAEIIFDIPESWAWCRLGNLVYNATGLAYSKEALEVKSDSPIRVLRGGNILEGSWILKDDGILIAPEFVNEKLLLKHGTFITPAVTSIERIGKTALVREDHDNMVVGGFVLMLLPFWEDCSLLDFLLLFFQTAYYKQYSISITNKSGQAFYNISRTKLMQCLVPVPPSSEQLRIVEFFERIANTMSR